MHLKRISKRSAKGWEPSLPPHTPHPTPHTPTQCDSHSPPPNDSRDSWFSGKVGKAFKLARSDRCHWQARGNDALANLASHVHLHGPTTRVPTEAPGHDHDSSGGKGHHQRGGGGEGGGTRGPWRVSGGPKTQPGTRRGQIFPLSPSQRHFIQAMRIPGHTTTHHHQPQRRDSSPPSPHMTGKRWPSPTPWARSTVTSAASPRNEGPKFEHRGWQPHPTHTNLAAPAPSPAPQPSPTRPHAHTHTQGPRANRESAQPTARSPRRPTTPHSPNTPGRQLGSSHKAHTPMPAVTAHTHPHTQRHTPTRPHAHKQAGTS